MTTTESESTAQYWVSISATSPRYDDWAKWANDTNCVPITSPTPQLCMLPIGVQPCVFLRYDLLTPGEQARLILVLATRFGIDPQEVQDEIDADPQYGVPLLVDDDLRIFGMSEAPSVPA